MIRRATLLGAYPSVRHSVSAVIATQASRRSFLQATPSEEMPLKGLADRIGDAFGPALDAIAAEQRKGGLFEAKEDEIYVPSVPHIFPVTRMARDSPFVRDVLVFDERQRLKPRMSWYDPYDTTWVPSGWFADGIQADMDYYFGSGSSKPAKCGSQHFISPGSSLPTKSGSQSEGAAVSSAR